MDLRTGPTTFGISVDGLPTSEASPGQLPDGHSGPRVTGFASAHLNREAAREACDALHLPSFRQPWQAVEDLD